jgi:outer membrane protein OmpA-like peptidoglycan-associated protein
VSPAPGEAGGALQEAVTPVGGDDAGCAPLFQVSFESESDLPRGAELEAQVTRLARWVGGHPAAKVRVEGHADAFGSDEFNLLLSFRRARAVAALLQQAGVAPHQILIRAYGESEPLDRRPESARNRRVSLTIADYPRCPPAAAERGNGP